ncbi:MAG: FMN-binding protein [Spirochaetaceae bacterium]|nr:FMN-binding protein [Spirochaetaceae bacterium]
MKKYFVPLVCGAAFVFAACLSFNSMAVFKAGEWEGFGEGYNGTIHVLVETDSTSILDIKVLRNDDDPLIGGGAIDELKEFVLETDSTDVDAVSGATQSSEGFIEAVEDALSKARLKK